MIEWENVDSKLFKGYNKLHEKTNELNNLKNNLKLYKEIQAHNSIYYNNLNTLMIATAYRDLVFYLPSFLDFRGRIYSKVSYLNYQGGDLARSLLEFYSPNSNLNKTNFKDSFNYIKQYAGNVYNLSKKTIRAKIK